MTNTKSTERVVGRAVGCTKSCKITGWIKATYRIFYEDGTSNYLSLTMAQFEGQSNKDSADYLIGQFQEEVGTYGLQRVKLISVGGEKFNIMIS